MIILDRLTPPLFPLISEFMRARDVSSREENDVSSGEEYDIKSGEENYVNSREDPNGDSTEEMVLFQLRGKLYQYKRGKFKRGQL